MVLCSGQLVYHTAHPSDGAQQKRNFKTYHKSSRRYATTLSQCVTVWSVSCSKTERPWKCIALMPTVIILNISMTFKTFSHRENIGFQCSDLSSIKRSYLIQQDVWRQLFTFLHFMFLIFHWHFHPNNFNNIEHQLTVILGWYICVYHWRCIICY